MKAGRDALGRGGIGKHVAGQLFDDKLIERQVVIDGADNPITILPHDSRGIMAVAVAIRITGGVQPMTSPAFAVSR